MFYKKSLSAVVAISLLLVVTVVSVIGFQTWFNNYSTNLFTKSETQGEFISSVELNNLIDGTLYVKSSIDINESSIKINSLVCNSNVSLLVGVNQIDIETCLDDLSSPKIEVVLSNSKGVKSKFFFVTTSNLFSCGDSVSYENQVYPTIRIGTQCWLQENLNVGEKLSDASTTPSNDSKIEKWCHQNSDSRCDSGGGLYTWAEAMQFNSSCLTSSCSSLIETNHQGICPDNWHIPTSSEQHILENFYSNTTCDGDRDGDFDCAPAGTELKSIADDSFSGLLAGSRLASSSFQHFNVFAFFWSSSENNSVSSKRHLFFSTSNATQIRSINKTEGYSVRCIRN